MENEIDNKEETSEKRSAIVSVISSNRDEILKWNGWGFKDTEMLLGEEDGKFHFYFTGNRYPCSNEKLPLLANYFNEFGIDVTKQKPKPTQLPPEKFAKPSIPEDALNDLTSLGISYSLDGMNRLNRAHGQAMEEIILLRELKLPKIPDVVVWPSCHDQVVQVVEMAESRNMVVIPFGGGSAVTGACNCPKTETRTVIVLDTSRMANILWIDEDNLTACCEAGITGKNLEESLAIRGYTCGHEPDSYELSTLGGWVATRASGMKKNMYGNIEDLVVHVKMVTPRGVLDKKSVAPRMSCGPDFNHVILGSEGTLGVITEVVIKIRPLSEIKRCCAYLFPSFETGFQMIREVTQSNCQPASIRLMDNTQFKFGYAMSPEKNYFKELFHNVEVFYITKIKGFSFDKISVLTVLYEGSKVQVNTQEKSLHTIAKKYDGICTGEEHGKRGYSLTFLIAYFRDIFLNYGIISESFETSVPWNKALTLVNNVEMIAANEGKKLGIKTGKIGFRITQTYDAGCVVYFYYAFNTSDIPQEDPLKALNRIEDAIREEILQVGASVSHHHGIGKRKAPWYPRMVSQVGADIYQATKDRLDHKNIFACGNLLPKSDNKE